ncbi:hypothetical protein Bca52824_080045 [Brassica carinata]|uniref:tRNA pseudouridine(55) synthase n=1 Tax=Brassica carinata TaxID=52824 RepID=A0A8X7U2G8_BRACI|nr:hypothetical protein Bca52824_080045 [Brassica carinata]
MTYKRTQHSAAKIRGKSERDQEVDRTERKYSRNLSQTRWIIDDERMSEASVEEIIGGNILPECVGDSYKFHAAALFRYGCWVQVDLSSQQSLTEIEEKINNSEKKLLKILNIIGSQCWAMMREGEAEKQVSFAKCYRNIVILTQLMVCNMLHLYGFAGPLEEKDINSIPSLKELKIFQKTPVRVLHRRSPLERERTIHWMKVEKIKGSSHYFPLHLCTQAGTYIKEFVHGDLGRTSPSMGSILGCRAEILQLDVTDVKMGDS